MVCSASTTARRWRPDPMLGRIGQERLTGRPRFRVARNPDPESQLPYLIWLPIEAGLVLKARETWPRATRVFCAQDATPWDASAGLLDDVPVLLCRRRVSCDRPGSRPAISVRLSIRLHRGARTAGDLVANPEDSSSRQSRRQNPSRAVGRTADDRHRYAREVRLEVRRPYGGDRAPFPSGW